MSYLVKDLLRVAQSGDFEQFERLLRVSPIEADEIAFGKEAQKIRSLDYELRLSDREELDRFDERCLATHPDWSICVSYWDVSSRKKDEKVFLTVQDLDAWVEQQRQWAWDDRCQGLGDGSIDFLGIVVTYPGGRTETIS